MQAESVDSIICPRCNAELAASEDVCRECGASTHSSSVATKPGLAGLMESKWLNNPWVVLGLCFFALAIFGLPLIWKTRAFTRPGKFAVSIVVTLYTILILWLFYLVMAWSISRINDAMQLY